MVNVAQQRQEAFLVLFLQRPELEAHQLAQVVAAEQWPKVLFAQLLKGLPLRSVGVALQREVPRLGDALEVVGRQPNPISGRVRWP
jgi:hypothetical protein